MIYKGDSEAGAVFSFCEKYRYRLWRSWGIGSRALFVMLNPSTATELALDPTVSKCVRYAKAWGFSGLEVVNIFAYRSTDPANMKRQDAPIGVNNDNVIVDVARSVDDCGGQVICAWGQHGLHQGRGNRVRNILIEAGISAYFLRMGANNQPWHPLYLPGNLTPIAWEF
jgi:hypothetical protein